MATKKKNEDVIELEAEEVNLDAVISDELVKHNITDAVIAGLKDKYGGLQLKSIDDRESYLEIKEARKDVRQWGIAAEKICKKGRESAIAIQKKWLSKEKEVLQKIEEVQNPLDAEIKKFEDEENRKEQERIRAAEEAYLKRQQTLLKYGATYNNGSFELNHISYDADTVKGADEEIWAETILPKYHREYEKNEAERVAQEKKREEEAAALKAQQEEMDRQRKELEEQQRLFREQQEQLKKQQDEAEQIRREAEEKLRREETERREAVLRNRANQLQSLGMKFNFQYDAYVFEDVNVDNKTELCLFDETQWIDLIAKITPVIEQRKADAEEKRLADIERQKQIAAEAAAQQERERIAKEQAEKELQRQQEEARKAEELEKASDKEKWNNWLEGAIKLLIPPTTMKSPYYKSKSQEAQNLLNKIINL